MYLRQPTALGKPGFSYSTCGPLTKNILNKVYKKEYLQKLKLRKKN